jgi:hypothetical protein
MSMCSFLLVVMRASSANPKVYSSEATSPAGGGSGIDIVGGVVGLLVGAAGFRDGNCVCFLVSPEDNAAIGE